MIIQNVVEKYPEGSDLLLAKLSLGSKSIVLEIISIRIHETFSRYVMRTEFDQKICISKKCANSFLGKKRVARQLLPGQIFPVKFCLRSGNFCLKSGNICPMVK